MMLQDAVRALFAAAKNEHIAVVEALLAAGTDVNAKIKVGVVLLVCIRDYRGRLC
jgi:hypothetical protein